MYKLFAFLIVTINLSLNAGIIEETEKYLLDKRGIVIEADFNFDKYEKPFDKNDYLDYLNSLIYELDKLPEGKLYAPFKIVVQSKDFNFWYYKYVKSNSVHFNFRNPERLSKFIKENCPLIGSVEHQEKQEHYEKLKNIAFNLIREIEAPSFLDESLSLKLNSLDNDLWERANALEESNIFYLTAKDFVLGLLKIKHQMMDEFSASFCKIESRDTCHIALTTCLWSACNNNSKGTVENPYLLITKAHTVYNNYKLKKYLESLL